MPVAMKASGCASAAETRSARELGCSSTSSSRHSTHLCCLHAACVWRVAQATELGCRFAADQCLDMAMHFSKKRTQIPVCRLQIFCELLVAGWLTRMRAAWVRPLSCLSRSSMAAAAGSSCCHAR